MPGPNLKKINQLLGSIRDPKYSDGQKAEALRQLESQVNQYATTTESRFEASLATFDAQWKEFQEAQDGLMASLDSMMAGDADATAVDLLMQQIQDENRLERAAAPNSPSVDDLDLERRIEALRVFSKPHDPKPSKKDHVPDELDESEPLADREDLNFDFLLDVEESLDSTERDLDDLEDELSKLEDESSKKDRKLAKAPKPLEETTVSHHSTETIPTVAQPVRNNNPPSPQEETIGEQRAPQKSSSGEGFLKNIKSFFTSIADFFKNLGSKPVSLESAIGNLKIANKELATAGTRLKQDQKKLFDAGLLLQGKQGELKSRFSEQLQVQKNLNVQRVALAKLQSDTKPNPQQKREATTKMKEKIANTQTKYQEISADVRRLTSQLTSLTNKLTETHSKLKESIHMHKTANDAVKKGVGDLESACKKNKQTMCVQEQTKLKSLLHTSKENFNRAEQVKQAYQEKEEQSHSGFKIK